jgi:hypothetical protein
MKCFLSIALLSFCSAPSVFAWGGRGHHSICHSAVFLLKEDGLRDYLQSRPQVMGHLCNIPDIYWKSLGGDIGKQGNPAHFIDVEITGLTTKEIPSDYQKIVSKYTGETNQFKKEGKIFSVPTEFGSLWWRADQFFRRAINLEKDWKKAIPPANPKEEQDDSLPFNKSAHDFIVNLGLMGHFVGDAGQPFHSTADYDGYAVGHGGIHSYFEDQGVSVIGPDLEMQVISTAKKMQDAANSKDKELKKTVQFLTAKNAVEKMRALSQLSYAEIKTILTIDPLRKPSEEKKEKGMSLRTPAEREDIKTVAGKLEPIIVQEMARSAALLAHLWDEAYIKVGKPKLTAYKSYKYPFTPEFVAPDYFEEKAAK